MSKSNPITASVPEFKKVATASVLLDPKNPRLGAIRTPSQPKLQEILLEEPHFAKDLVESFVENGFIEYEPLVVRESGDTYVVIEGNRRLAAVKHILDNPSKYPDDIVQQLKQVPVLVFHEKADASHLKDIRTYLGVRHLQGYREWPAESKAIFLDRNIKADTDLKKLKSEFGIERKDIARFLVPYRVRKSASKLLDNLDLGEDPSFWILGEALARSDIKEYIQLKLEIKTFKVVSFDKKKFQHLIEFLYGSSKKSSGKGSKRVTDTRQLTRLGKVLANKRASEKLEKGSTLDEAEMYISTPEETINNLSGALRIIFRQIKSLEPTPEQVAKIENDCDGFLKAIKARLNT